MEPRELLRRLNERAKLNPTSLAARLHNRTTQPQIFKFLNGTAKEPKRSTLQPVADFYGVPVEAFYDAEVAQQVAEAQGLTEQVSAGGREKQQQPVLMELTPEQAQLLQDLKDLAPSRAAWFTNAVREAAEEAREIRADEAAKAGKPREKTAAARKSGSKSSATIKYGDGNRRQGSLPLTTVPNPFTAQPNEREAAFYHRVERAPKEPHGEGARSTDRKPK